MILVLIKYQFLQKPYGLNKSIKFFIGYNDNDESRPVCIMLPQITGYVKCFESNKTTSFKASDNKLLKRYTEIREKVRNLLNVKFDSESFMVIMINT